MAMWLTARVNGDWILADPVREPRGFLGRGIGWMGARRPAEGTGLLFRHCRALHLLFMRFPLDIVYLDAEYRVAAVRLGVKPWRATRGPPSARHALEMPASARAARLQPGDRVEFVRADGPDQKR